MAQIPRITRKVRVGMHVADAIVEMAHMMYNKNTATGFLEACIKRLKERMKEFK